MKRIRKMYSGVVPNGKVLTMDSNSNSDTYSCAYLNDKIKSHDYSTEEIRIGTWIDGKPLYRKVFIANVDSDMETGSKVIATIENVRTKRYESFFVENNNPGAVDGGTRFSDTDQVWCYITTGGEIKARVYGSYYVGRTLIVIVEYTKPTD